MYQLIISAELNSYDVSPNDKAIFALESFLSPQEFKEAFLKSINEFVEKLKPYQEAVERTNKVFSEAMEKFELESSEYKDAEQPFIEAYTAENKFIAEHGIFVHNGFKAEKLKFKPEEGVPEFEVYELLDWFALKKDESSKNFESTHVRMIEPLDD
jgi:hypothetical protein